MKLVDLDRLDDPRLHPYRHLRQTNWTRYSGLFIAEGRRVVARLLQSRFPVRSLLVSRRRLGWLEEMASAVPPDVPVFVLPHPLAQQLVGYNFHTGILACGSRLPEPELDRLVAPGEKRQRLVVCTRMENPDNLGTVIRLAAGFGCQGVLLGRGSADPFSRRVLRVSMGQALFVPVRWCEHLEEDLSLLRSRYGYTLLGAEVTPQATPLYRLEPPQRCALLLGNEDRGLTPSWLALCDHVAQIPMAPGADSLNVAVAAAVFLYHLNQPSA